MYFTTKTDKSKSQGSIQIEHTTPWKLATPGWCISFAFATFDRTRSPAYGWRTRIHFLFHLFYVLICSIDFWYINKKAY